MNSKTPNQPETGLEAWKREFYSVPANSETLDDDVKRLDHALRKWKGLREEELARFGVTREELEDSEFLGVDSCSLCQAHHSETCSRCPFVTIRGKQCHEDGELYDVYYNQEDSPEPMIIALQEMRQAVEQRRTSKKVADTRAKLVELKRKMEELAAEIGESDPWKVGGTD